MYIMSQFMRDSIAENMADCKWVERDNDSGQLYIKFDEIRITDKTVKFLFNGEEISSIQQELYLSGPVDLCIVGFEGRMKFDIHL